MAKAKKATEEDIQRLFAEMDITAQDPAIGEKEYLAFITGVARSVGQGVSFGTADEAEAFLRSLVGDEGYTQIRNEIRSNIDKFRDENFALAYGLEIGSSMLVPGGAARVGARVAPALTQAAVSAARTRPVTAAGLAGAAYGAGAAEEMADVPLEATLAGTMGMGLQKLAPAISRRAAAMREAGLPLTIGQLYPGLRRAEEAFTSVPIMGGQVAKAMQEPVEAFPALVYNRALRPLGISIDPKASPRKAFQQAEKAFRKAYDEALSDVEVDVTPDFIEMMANISKTAKEELGVAGEALSKDFDAIIKSRVMGKIKDGKLTGDDLKEIQTFIGQKSARNRASPDPVNQDFADALDDLDIGLMDAFAKAAPQKREQLMRANRAYSRYVPIRRAASAAGEAEFTPAKLMQAIRAEERKKGAAGLGRLAAGRGTMQPLAEIGMDVIGRQLPDSGTAERLMKAQMLRTGLTGLGLGGGGVGYATDVISPFQLGAGIGIGLLGAGAYTRPGQAALRRAIPAVGRVMTAPAIPGLISDSMTVSP